MVANYAPLRAGSLLASVPGAGNGLCSLLIAGPLQLGPFLAEGVASGYGS